MKKKAMKSVRYDGPAVAVGRYLPGKVYEVEADEADRLIAVKGFTDVDAEEASAVKE